jgi:hypothetical protein
MNGVGHDKGVFCHLCGRRIVQGRGHYVVRIEVFVADDPPEKLIFFDTKKAFQEEVNKLLDDIAQTDPQELEDQVYKFFKFDICRLCQREFIKNPIARRI